MPNSEELDLFSLRCFMAGASLPTFRQAARSVSLSPTAFSERIQSLEAQLGAPLFERTTRRVDLTPQGQRLLPHARQLMEDARRALEAITDESQRPPFALTIGTRFELGLSWLVPALSELEQSVPARQLHLRFGDTHELLPGVRGQSIDAMITSARVTAMELDFERLHAERYLFVQRKCDRSAQLRRADDAPTHTLVDAHPDLPLFRYLLEARPAEEEWTFRRTETLGTIAAVRARVLEGVGVAVLPEYFVRDDLRRGALVRLLPRTRLRSDWFRLIWRRGHPRQDDLRALAAELRARPLR